MQRFGDCPRRVGSSAFRFGVAAGRVGLRVHRFRFSARTASEIAAGRVDASAFRFGIALGELAFGLTASAFRYAPLRDCRWASWPSGSPLPLFGMHRFGVALGELVLLPSVSAFATRRVGASAFRFGVAAGRVGLRTHDFRFSARAASGLPLGGLVLLPSASELPFGGLAFGFIASAFRHAPLRSGPRRVGSSAGRVGLWAHRFRFSARADSEWPLGGWPSGLLLRRLPFGGLAFGLTASEIPLGGLAFGFTASAFRHAPIRSGCWASSFFRLPFRRLPSAGWPSDSLLPLFGTRRFGDCRWAGWPSGSLLPLFGMRRSAPPRRRSEDRRSTTTRQLFHFKTLIPTC